MKEGFEFSEYGIGFETSKTYLCVKSFMLRTINGPLQEIKPGALVRLSDRMGAELFFANKITPVVVPELFEVVIPFQMVNKDGEYENVNRGDVVRLNRDEALKYLKESKVIEKVERPK